MEDTMVIELSNEMNNALPQTTYGELNRFRDGVITLVEATAEKSNVVTLEIIKFLRKRNYSFVIINTSRPIVSLLNFYKENNLDYNDFIFIDMVTKKYARGQEEQFAIEEGIIVKFIETPSDLTELSLVFDSVCNTIKNKKTIVFFDSISTMLLYNENKVLARFVHAMLIKMRINKFGGFLLLLKGQTDNLTRAEIVHLCDKILIV